MKIVMVGSGNTATVLCVLIQKAGHEIVQIVSRNINNAQALASLYNTSSTTLTDAHFAEADMYILALHDTALDHIERVAALKGKLVVHTAGSVSINVLKDCSNTYGVLYPLQSLSKFTEHIPAIPFLVDGNTQEVLHKVLGFAKSLTGNVTEANERSNTVTTVTMNGHDPAALQRYCKEKCGVVLGTGIGDLSGQAFRIAHMGHVNAPMILGTLGVIEVGLNALDIPHGKGGTEAAIEYLGENVGA